MRDYKIAGYPKKELKPGDLVIVYDGKDAEGIKHHKKVGLILGTVGKPTKYMQFFTYKVHLGYEVARVHEVWIKKIETGEVNESQQ